MMGTIDCHVSVHHLGISLLYLMQVCHMNTILIHFKAEAAFLA